FFQAEDGIRDFHVTGVQTCALPISVFRKSFLDILPVFDLKKHYLVKLTETPGIIKIVLYQGVQNELHPASAPLCDPRPRRRRHRSEERRVGKSVGLGGRRMIKKEKK